jgi:hypothetical protein
MLEGSKSRVTLGFERRYKEGNRVKGMRPGSVARRVVSGLAALR